MSRAVLLLAAVLLLSGCTNAPDSAPAVTTPTATTSTPAISAARTSAAPTGATQPVTAEGACSYLDTAFVQETVGQRIARTTYTTTSHELLPSCTFYRPDGEPAADVALTAFPTVLEARNAAITRGTTAANPVDDVADGGVVLVTEGSTVLAVTSGRILLVVTINQASSLEAQAIAAEVAPLLG